MSKQYNKAEKRMRRNSYLKRKKAVARGITTAPPSAPTAARPPTPTPTAVEAPAPAPVQA